MTQLLPGHQQNPCSTLKTRGLTRALIPCYSKATELQNSLDTKQHSKVELVLLQGKKHEAHLLGKLSPYFRSCVSQELLKSKLSSSEKLQSLCYSCNRTLDRRLEQTISFNRIKLKRRAFAAMKNDKDEDTAEQLTTTPWKYNREQQYTSQTETSCTPFQRFEKAQSFAEFSKKCFSNRSPPLILPEVIKITPQKKKTPRPKASSILDVGLAPPPTPIIRYIRDLSPEVRNIFSEILQFAKLGVLLD